MLYHLWLHSKSQLLPYHPRSKMNKWVPWAHMWSSILLFLRMIKPNKPNKLPQLPNQLHPEKAKISPESHSSDCIRSEFSTLAISRVDNSLSLLNRQHHPSRDRKFKRRIRWHHENYRERRYNQDKDDLRRKTRKMEQDRRWEPKAKTIRSTGLGFLTSLSWRRPSSPR